MKRALIILLLAAAVDADAANVRVRTNAGAGIAGQAGSAGAAVSGGLAGSGAGTVSLVPSLQAPLSVPSVSPSLVGGPKAAAPAAGIPSAARTAVPSAEAAAAFKAPLVRPGKTLALPAVGVSGTPGRAVPSIGGSSKGRNVEDLPSETVHGRAAKVEKAFSEISGPDAVSDENAVEAGRASFDGAGGLLSESAPPAPVRGFSIWRSVRRLLRPDKAPAYPGKAGETARLEGQTYKLERKAFEDEHSTAWLPRFEDRITVRLVKPGGEAAIREELAALRILKAAGVGHREIREVGEDGRIVVQDNLTGDSMAHMLKKGVWARSRQAGYVDMAAKMIRAGLAADVRPGDMVYEHWRSRWSFSKVSGLRKAGAWEVLSRFWNDEILDGAGLPRAHFLSGLRGRFGVDSPEWRELVKSAEGVPELKKAMDALARRDAARPPPEKLVFEAETEKGGNLDDTLLMWGRLKKQLGYDPLGITPRTALHADDPGKLNTNVFSIPTKDGKRVVKVSNVEVIRNELFLRKVVHRFFAKYFMTPWSVAVYNGMDSLMVMQTVVSGARATSQTPMTRDQRAAMAVLMRTFGVYDVNAGNVYYPYRGKKGRVGLIDFEQALGKTHPVPGRIPDQTLLQELPWVNHSDVVMEDFLEAIAQWREFFHRPKTQAAVREMMEESGFSPDEIEHYMGLFAGNVRRLEWTLQTDVDFSKNFYR